MTDLPFEMFIGTNTMMPYKRKKLLLDLVHAAGGELAVTDLQKLPGETIWPIK